MQTLTLIPKVLLSCSSETLVLHGHYVSLDLNVWDH